MEQNPKFKNVHNTMYNTEKGIKWDSRACAVVCHVWFIKNGEPFVLIGKRGPGSDYPDKWNIPCGYLDWNENLNEAMFREVWEETGLDLSKFYGPIVYAKYKQPWMVYSEPSENHQNVAMHMGIVVDLIDEELPTLSLDNMEEEESTGCFWMHYDTASEIKREDWAFNHKTRLQEMYDNILDVRLKYCK